MNRILTVFKILVGVLSAILFIRVATSDADVLEVDQALQASVLSPYMIVAYVILALTVLLTLVFTVKGLFAGNVKKTLISIVAFVAIILIAYGASTGKEVMLDNGETLSENASRWISAGLTSFYILVVISVLAIIFSSIRKIITSRG